MGSGEGDGGTDTGGDNTESSWWSSWTGLDDFGAYVGGILSSSINTLLQPLEFLANAFSSGLNAVGSALDGVGSSIGGWFSELGSNISGFFTDLKTDWVKDWTRLQTDLQNIKDFFSSLVNWLNPFHEDFFLKVAFIPDEQFMTDYRTKWDTLLHSKLGFFFQLVDTFTALNTAVESKVTGWEGIKIDLSRWGGGEQEIVSAYAINYYGEKMRFWIGGLMIFLTGAWLIKKLSAVVGAGR